MVDDWPEREPTFSRSAHDAERQSSDSPPAHPALPRKEKNMRSEFDEITSGWTLIDGLDDLTERIECAAEWTKANGPLEPDECARIELMIRTQIARGAEAPITES